MAIKGKAAKSATGASMSKYDVEVEGRLQALESSVHSHKSGGGDVASLEAKVDALIEILNRSTAVTQHCPKNADGIRTISL